MYAIIKTGGKQYRVSEGDVIYLEKVQAEPGQTVSFQEVLVVGLDDKVMVGTPYVENATVTARVVNHGKAKKIVVVTKGFKEQLISDGIGKEKIEVIYDIILFPI